MKTKTWFTVFLALLILITMCASIGCDDSDEKEENASILIGTWYRFSLKAGPTDLFVPSKVVMHVDGTGINYTTEVEDGLPVDATNEFTWADDNGTMSIYGSNGELEYSSPYSLSEDSTKITTVYEKDSVDVTEVSVKYCIDHESALAGDWYGLTISRDGQETPIHGWEFSFSMGGSYSFTGWGTEDTGIWGTNDTYLMSISNSDIQGRDYCLFRYYLSNHDSLLTLSGYETDWNTDSGDPTVYQVTMVLTKGAGTEIEIDPNLVGVWYTLHYDLFDGNTTKRLNIPTRQMMYADGTGIREYFEGGTLVSETFAWEASNNNLTEYDTDGQIRYSAPYYIVDNSFSLTYDREWMDGEDYTMTILNIRESDEHDASLAGEYLPLAKTANGVFIDSQEITYIYEDGTGSSARLEGDTVTTEEFTWTTGGDYLFLYREEMNGLACVMGYNFDDTDVLDFFYYDDIDHMNLRYIRNNGGFDPSLIGTWGLTNRLLNGDEDPDMPDSATLTVYDDATGSERWGSTETAFTLTTNMHWLLQYNVIDGVRVGRVCDYTVNENILVLDYMQEDGTAGTEVSETWTRQ